MEWLKELLKKLGVEDSKIDGFISDVNKELPKHFMPKQQYNEVVEAKKKAEKDVTDRDKQITELGKAAGLTEELKKQIETMQTENQAAAEKHAAEMKDLQLSNAIKSALAGKVHDEDLVAGLFEKDKLVVNDGKVVGLDEQLKTLQESKAFLFKSEDGQQKQQTPPGFRVGGGGNPNPPATTATLKDAIAAHFQK
ncbi:phage scaffolding protein [Paenibacillus motobuensis]|uniref:phage scaffolding protein n=1 Tax=Paenibacillus TaxID=44249 RepID=UPI002040199A|nr:MULTISPECIES: phage scaffolding protein [Paenibacillus]MCM3041707.1 phage scaffolding protein [Paenibacillus lutimineralis]MCM3648811.1 phage scaffolding protein [Paenibacillus motobuensis]